MRRILSLALLVAGALRADTVLVLSFFNHAKSANLDWVGESIAQSVRDSLASEGVLVLAREDRLEAYRRLALRPGAELTHASIIKIVASLKVCAIRWPPKASWCWRAKTGWRRIAGSRSVPAPN